MMGHQIECHQSCLITDHHTFAQEEYTLQRGYLSRDEVPPVTSHNWWEDTTSKKSHFKDLQAVMARLRSLITPSLISPRTKSIGVPTIRLPAVNMFKLHPHQQPTHSCYPQPIKLISQRQLTTEHGTYDNQSPNKASLTDTGTPKGVRLHWS